MTMPALLMLTSQFDITDTPDVISLVDADGGVASESDFLISTNEILSDQAIPMTSIFCLINCVDGKIILNCFSGIFYFFHLIY